MSKKNKQLRVDGKRVFLRYPKRKDAERFLALSKSSVNFHRGLVSPPKDKKSFEKHLEISKSNAHEMFLICEKSSESIIGVMNLSQIFYGKFKNAYLGYYLFEKYSRQGYMTDAILTVLRFAFRDLKLHRLEANIQPNNFSSIGLVKKCGFRYEGLSQKYLKIGGIWRDHERWAIIREDLKRSSGKKI